MKKVVKKKVNKNKKGQLAPTTLASTKFGQRAADQVTKWAGSWTFILTFIGFLLLWIVTNTYAWLHEWDPFPFILLNLVLSCIAALQAPIILMSQNRAAEKDRQRAEYDYAVNRRAEREISDLKKQLTRIEKYLHK
ncbi:MAG: DUF1003 domain-containing protein [Nanoarchaeota archaeon]|jgi:uncharacterized membrane protein|nr:DUF1003 domain-containing protein [Nanoarchaeota archaeon]